MSKKQEEDLSHKIEKLNARLHTLQHYSGSIITKIHSALRKVTYIKNKTKEEKRIGKDDLRANIVAIEINLKELEDLINAGPQENETETTIYHKIRLKNVLNFGILDIETDTITLSVCIKGRLFEIITILLKKYIEDTKKNVPVEFRGYVSRKELEIEIYGKYIGRNRLNSHLTRMRSIFHENGLPDTGIVKSLDEYLRLNIDCNDVSITEMVDGDSHPEKGAPHE